MVEVRGVVGEWWRWLESRGGGAVKDGRKNGQWVRLNVPVRRIRTDNRTEFVNQTLRDYYEEVGISHETSVARSPQQNGVVERRNRTLIEAAYTMLIYAQAPLFLWAEAVATDSSVSLTAFADADHAGCQDTRRSTSG
nr:putative ribonuclease H-like domain-containing protein [Tanacetum cinerariifolium]